MRQGVQPAANVRVFTRATSLGGTHSYIEHRASIEGPGTALEAEAGVLAPDYVAHVPAAPGPLEGLETWRRFSGSFAEAFPDLRLTVEDIMAEGDMVAARVAFRGTHRGEFQGIPPTDKEVAFTAIEVNRVRDGKVEEHWVELDLLGLMQQLGAIPEPGHSEEASPT